MAGGMDGKAGRPGREGVGAGDTLAREVVRPCTRSRTWAARWRWSRAGAGWITGESMDINGGQYIDW